MLLSKAWSVRALQFLRRLPSITAPPKSKILPSNVSIEEENSPGYKAEDYYPVRLGDILNKRYQILSKLGFGVFSTVWLARDTQSSRWQPNRYVALKINTRVFAMKGHAEHELDISRQLEKGNPSHEGRQYVRLILDSFKQKGPHGTHLCLVFEPLREALSMLQRRMKDRCYSSHSCKEILAVILEGLEYIHDECHIIHTDLQLRNIMVTIEDPSVIEDYLRIGIDSPAPQKEFDDGRVIYLSCDDFGEHKKDLQNLKISDFGLAAFGDASEPNTRLIQPDFYRAPEVVLGAEWSYSVDIWNIAMTLWDMMGNGYLFEPVDPNSRTYSPEMHLAQMIAVLGPPPREFLARGTRTSTYFDVNGAFMHSDLVSGYLKLSDSVPFLHGQDKELFLDFVSKMLCWLPEERNTAKELRKHPWLHTYFDKEELESHPLHHGTDSL